MNVPFRLISIISSHCASVICSNGTKREIPALLTRMVMGPKACRSFSTAALTSSRFAMLACRAMALPPPDTILPATAVAPSNIRSSTPMAIPSRAKRWQMAAPIPAPAPVTRATFELITLPFGQLDFSRRGGHGGVELIGHLEIDLHDGAVLVVHLLTRDGRVHDRDITGEGRAAVRAVGMHDQAPFAGPTRQIVQDPRAHRGTVAIAARHPDEARPARKQM